MHERKVEGCEEPLELRVSGAVLHGNLIMFDKETDTRWLQETGSALEGQQKGKALKELDDQQWEQNVRWDVWYKKHPESQLLFCSHCEQENKKAQNLTNDLLGLVAPQGDSKTESEVASDDAQPEDASEEN